MIKHTIEVNEIKVYGFHGCLAEEAKIGGNYTVDVCIETDFSNSTKSDDLNDTLDYVTINLIVKEEMAIRSKLIEHVGQRIVERIKSSVHPIFRIQVKVVKICPPINGDVKNVAIIIEEVII